MEGGAPEDEVAGRAPRGCHEQPSSAAANAALDVAKILFQHLDGQTELTSEIIELPLSGNQSFNDFLTTSPRCHHHSHPLRSNVLTF